MEETPPTKIEGRGNEINQRIAVIRHLVEKYQIKPRADLREDVHYWYLVLKDYWAEQKILKEYIEEEEKLREASIHRATQTAEDKYDLEQKASIDGLTGAWSRRSLDNYLERVRHIRRDEAGNETVTGLLLMDIDGFKKINDVLGHLAGDNALKAVVVILKGKARGTDMDARYGGDEFALVMPYIPSIGIAVRRAEAIFKAVQERTGFTISIGVTVARDTDKSIEDIYKRVDANLYKAKNAGKSLIANDNGIIT